MRMCPIERMKNDSAEYSADDHGLESGVQPLRPQTAGSALAYGNSVRHDASASAIATCSR